jgi:predicted nuclease of predicted toxin-antitoxin system
MRGFPPKVLWLRLGNCSTSDIERTLRNGNAAIDAFANDPTVGILELL